MYIFLSEVFFVLNVSCLLLGQCTKINEEMIILHILVPVNSEIWVGNFIYSAIYVIKLSVPKLPHMLTLVQCLSYIIALLFWK